MGALGMSIKESGEHQFKPELETVLQYVNKARDAIGLFPLVKLPKGLAPQSLLAYLQQNPEGWPEYNAETEKHLEAFPPAARVKSDSRSLGWLDNSWPSSTIWSPIGIALHCEVRQHPTEGSEWFLESGSTVAAKGFAQAFGTYGRSLSVRRQQTKDWRVVRLPQVLEKFILTYSKGGYPELIGPNPLEMRLHEIQSEIDARAFNFGTRLARWQRRRCLKTTVAVVWLLGLTLAAFLRR